MSCESESRVREVPPVLPRILPRRGTGKSCARASGRPLAGATIGGTGTKSRSAPRKSSSARGIDLAKPAHGTLRPSLGLASECILSFLTFRTMLRALTAFSVSPRVG